VYQASLLSIPGGSGSPVASTHPAGTRYTDNPNEVVTKNTVPTPKGVVWDATSWVARAE
jgi:hypothetical protein